MFDLQGRVELSGSAGSLKEKFFGAARANIVIDVSNLGFLRANFTEFP